MAEVLDPGKLEYVILLHFEADENGGMDRFLEGAPDSTLACSALEQRPQPQRLELRADGSRATWTAR